MYVTYVIVKIYVTERNDIVKRYSNVITVWRTSAIEVTALLKHLCSEMKGVQKRGNPSWCQTVILGTDISIYPSHQ